jgi:uncharacterized protein (DUF1684 family)
MRKYFLIGLFSFLPFPMIYSGIALAEAQPFEKTNESKLKEDRQHWKSEYQDELKSEEGWLALVGLFWLSDGELSMGSSKKSHIRLPNKMPADFGMLRIDGEHIQFTPHTSGVRLNGTTIAANNATVLKIDDTRIQFNHFQFFIIKREDRIALRLIDSTSPSRSSFKGVIFYDYDKSWRFKAKLLIPKQATKIKIETVYDTIRNDDFAGMVSFNYQGKEVQLKAVSYGADNPMYVMFADSTNQVSTYGAGRYLKINWPADNSDKVVVDFNYSYSPPCAFTEYATCPLPPKENRINFEVLAGEKTSD